MADLLPPVASQSREEQWQRALTSSLPMTPDMVGVRSVGMPQYQPVQFIQRTEVPHPSHRDYTMVETMKRDVIQKQERNNRVSIGMMRTMTPDRKSWEPPVMRAPDINNFRRVLKITIPKRFR